MERTRARPDGPWKEVGNSLIDLLCAVQHLREALDVVRRVEWLSTPSSINIKLML